MYNLINWNKNIVVTQKPSNNTIKLIYYWAQATISAVMDKKNSVAK